MRWLTMLLLPACVVVVGPDDEVPQPDDAWFACKTVDDCRRVDDNCAQCCHWAGVNVAHVTDYATWLRAQCDSWSGPECDCIDWAVVELRCDAGRCDVLHLERGETDDGDSDSDRGDTDHTDTDTDEETGDSAPSPAVQRSDATPLELDPLVVFGTCDVTTRPPG